MVVCMSSTGDCSATVGDWWWIYWIGPFAASWLVAETTALMRWNVDSEDGTEDGIENGLEGLKQAVTHEEELHEEAGKMEDVSQKSA